MAADSAPSTDSALSTDPAPSTPDHDLIARTRDGDPRAYADLWRLHADAGRRFARALVSETDADDVVAEAFAQILQALRNGAGPSEEFRPYLFVTIRNQSRSRSRRVADLPLDDVGEIAAVASDASEIVVHTIESSATVQAFRSLPSRWQRVLWLLEIEHLSTSEVARLMGLSPNGVSSLAFRAREGLRDAWVQVHVAASSPASECGWAREHLGSYARQHLTLRHTARLGHHLAACAACRSIADEAAATASVLPVAARGAAGT